MQTLVDLFNFMKFIYLIQKITSASSELFYKKRFRLIGANIYNARVNTFFSISAISSKNYCQNSCVPKVAYLAMLPTSRNA